MDITLPSPDTQLEFSAALIALRQTMLQEALFEAVSSLKIEDLDAELARYAPSTGLTILASRGMRGELVFATPMLLRESPKLLGYYRLLLGFSQKLFYSSETGLTGFKCFEDLTVITSAQCIRLHELCQEINRCSLELLAGLPQSAVSVGFVDDLTLLTLGPQLRGGANVRKGSQGIALVFEAIKKLVQHRLVISTQRKLEIRNSAGRTVTIELSPDPDIVINEHLGSSAADLRHIIAIEVKAGTDFSNIHNRIGEAEKSHQKAKATGYTECWTIVNVDKADTIIGKKESPSTNRFFLLSSILSEQGAQYDDFRNRIISLTGVPTQKVNKRRKVI